MLYVMQKGNQYIRLSDTGKVDYVGLKKATKFTSDEARRTRLKAPVKTRGFEILTIRQKGIAEFVANLFRSILLR